MDLHRRAEEDLENYLAEQQRDELAQQKEQDEALLKRPRLDDELRFMAHHLEQLTELVTAKEVDKEVGVVDPAILGVQLDNSTAQAAPVSAGSAATADALSVVLTQWHGVEVPANLELFNTNEAVAAYKELSSQLPPLAALSQAHLAALPLPIVAADYLPPRIQLLINTLPTLDNLATQLLRIVAVGPYQKIIDLALSPDTPGGATFRDLALLFEFTKRLYLEDDPFLNVEHLAPGMWKEGEKTPLMFRNREQLIELTLRKVNLATFLMATLGTLEVGFFYLNELFLDVFCPNNNLDPTNALSNMGNLLTLQLGVNTAIGDRVGKLLKPTANLYLDLKTQAYISAIEAGERLLEEILKDILPEDMKEILIGRRGVKNLSPTELDFVERCQQRKSVLLGWPEGEDLSHEYEWFTFLRDLFDYVLKNMGFIIWGKRGRQLRGYLYTPTVLLDTSTVHVPMPAHLQLAPYTALPVLLAPERDLDRVELNKITHELLPLEIQEQQIHLRINLLGPVRNSQRRPWTREEEKALRHALELKGPAWATILELFGAGGKISEALKNRSQVQLKDKARNWKIFFLRLGLPVPGYLQNVTGEWDRDAARSKPARRKQLKKTAAAPVPKP